MCSDFGDRIPYSAYLEAFSQTCLPLKVPDAAPHLEPRDDIWPTETTPVLRRAGDSVELVQLRWASDPAGRRPAGSSTASISQERPGPRRASRA